MLVQRETPEMATVIHAVTVAAFARPDPSAAASTGPDEPVTDPVEAALVNELRVSDAWIPALSFVAVEAGEVVGHVVCTRAQVDTRPALGLGPLSVHPDHQRRGVGSALMHAVIGAADALDEPVVVLLGNPVYYARFGFRLAEEFGITPPVEQWRPYFQARPLTAFASALSGPFRYAEPFSRV
jgi:putative acetyltransferase